METFILPTYGKASAITEVDKLENNKLMSCFITKLNSEFKNYAKTIVIQLFLRLLS